MADDRPVCELDLRSAVWKVPAEDPHARPLLASPVSCEILRVTPRRRVLKTSTAPALLIKQYFSGGLVQRAKNFLRGAPAEREWRALCGAAERGLPVPKPLALGALPGATLLVTEFIAPARTLDDLLRAPLGAARKMHILRAAALLLRAMHDAGYFQRDLHFGNLLVRNGDGALRLWLLDLQRVDVDPRRPRSKRWRDLAALHGGAAASLAERLRFLKTYLSAPPLLCRDERRLARRLDRAGRRLRLQLWRSRRKRCCADNWEFRPVRVGSLSGFARRSSWNAQLERVFAAPGGIPAGAVVLKDSRTTTVASMVIDAQKLFIKRYNFRGAGYALKNVFRSARAKRGWRAANDCHMRGVGAALPVAYLERRRWRVLQESFIVTAAVEGEELSHLLARGAARLRVRRELLGQLARWLRRLHERGLAPRDLKGENIIATRLGGSAYRFSLVDFDGIASVAPGRRARAKHLARLARSWPADAPMAATDRLHLVREYLGPATTAARRKLYRAVSRVAAS